MKVEPTGSAARLDEDCERVKVFILISWTMENMTHKKKRVGDNRYEQLFGAVLVKRGARKWHANYRRYKVRRTLF